MWSTVIIPDVQTGGRIGSAPDIKKRKVCGWMFQWLQKSLSMSVININSQLLSIPAVTGQTL